MELKLQHHDHIIHDTAAIFVRGAHPRTWLQAVDNWGIPLTGLRCFIIPEQHDPAIAAGLFIIFPQTIPGIPGQLGQAYGVTGRRLYIPVNASLTPVISETEFAQLLIWDYQVFHPAYGFFGFEEKDAVELPHFLSFKTPVQGSWDYARMGVIPAPPLMSLRLEPVTTEDIFSNIKNEVSSKPLSDLKPEKDPSSFSNLLDSIKRGILKAGVKALRALPEAQTPGTGNAALGRLFNWMEAKLDDLEQRRQKEIARLLDLLEKDPDEGLQYAIPINSTYQSRGTDDISTRLGRRNTGFSLGGLGGGTASGWNIGEDATVLLRNKYTAAAQKAQEQKDYRKAAYIYAHLLQDYYTAAAVLKEGKYYREAAVLYKEHLNNRHEAAACYEAGGLFPEAVELYTEINQHEKAGDLYVLMQREEAARQCYKLAMDNGIAGDDYLYASHIANGKLHDDITAKQLLLQGWHKKRNGESCLQQYFTISGNLAAEVQRVYEEETPEPLRFSLLKVLKDVTATSEDATVKDACAHVAYDVVSKDLKNGYTQSLHSLSGFVQDDKLLPADCSRYINTPGHYAPLPATTTFQLADNVTWRDVQSLGRHWVAIGYTTNTLHIARGNWNGEIRYFTLTVNNIFIKSYSQFFVNAGEGIASLYFHEGDDFHPFVTEDKLLQLPRLTIINASWPAAGYACLGDDGYMYHVTGDETMLEMDKMKITDSRARPEPILEWAPAEPVTEETSYSENMVYVNGHCFFGIGSLLCQITNKGKHITERLPADIWKLRALNANPLMLGIICHNDASLYLVGLHPTSVTHIPGADVVGACYLGNSLLAIAYDKKVVIFDTRQKMLHAEFSSPTFIKYLIKGPKRNQFAIVDEVFRFSIKTVED